MELLSLGYVYSCFSCTKQHGIDIPKQCLFLVPTTWRIAIPTPSTLQISFSLSSKVQNQEIISSFMIRFAMLHCHYAHNLWTLVFCQFGLHWVIPKMVSALLTGFCRHCSADLWGGHSTVTRTIWRQRNQHTFEGVEYSSLR